MASLPSFSAAFQTEEHRAFTLQANAGKVALFVHGFPGTPAEMRPVAELFHAHGWTAHALLLPGFGEDIDTLPTRTHDDWLNAVNRAYESLCGQGRVVVVGLSMGGALALQLAAKHGNSIDHLLLLAPFWKLNHVLWSALPVLKHVIPQFKPFKLFKPNFNDHSFREGVSRYLPQANLDDPQTQAAILDFAVPVGMFSHIRTAGIRAYELAPQVRAPITVIQGLQDELVTPQTTRAFVAYLKRHARVNYHELDGNHNLTDTALPQWQGVEQAIIRFLQDME